MNSNSVDIPFVCRLADMYRLNALSRKYAVKRRLGFKILICCLLVASSAVSFYNYWLRRAVFHEVIADTVGQLFIAIFFIAFPVFYMVMTYTVRHNRTRRRYYRNKHRGDTRMLHADESGVCICSSSRAAAYKWVDVQRIVECGDGFVFVCGIEYHFLPSRFLDKDNLRTLRGLIREHAGDRVIFVSLVELPDAPEACEKFAMLPLKGDSVYTAHVPDLCFKDYFKAHYSIIWRMSSEPALFLLFILFFLLLVIIFSSSGAFWGFLFFLLAAAFVYAVIRTLVHIYISTCYEFDVPGREPRTVTFYRDALYIESDSLRAVMDYDSVTFLHEKSDSVTIAGDEASVMICDEDTDSFEQIKELLKLKTSVR
ncbi:MAG: hypothetical protein IJL87_06940 [Clostridia bacterium]|nr:hypothetical protein [Clostridia bacterium]